MQCGLVWLMEAVGSGGRGGRKKGKEGGDIGLQL